MKFSCFICVCSHDKLEYFSQAVQSVLEQTLPPNELVICVDGTVNDEICEYIDTLDAQIVYTDSCGDHARARQTALDACQYDFVAVMDADDVALPYRFKNQCEYVIAHPETDVVGGIIQEFDEEKTLSCRQVKFTDGEIKRDMKKRCPFNQMTVLMKKSAVEKAGGYKSVYCNEDYYLWVRMAKNNCTFANLSQVLCRVRVGEKTYERRGGKRYFDGEMFIQKYMHTHKMIAYPRMCFNIAVRFFVQRVAANKLRQTIYNAFLRKNIRKNHNVTR